MKTWDELGDKDPVESARRKNTEWWIRQQKLDDRPITVEHWHHELLVMNRNAMQENKSAPFAASKIFVREVINRMRIEKLCEVIFEAGTNRRKNDVIAVKAFNEKAPAPVVVSRASKIEAEFLMAEECRRRYELPLDEPVPLWAWRAFYAHKKLEDLREEDYK